jgi:hypothetical protein
MNRIQEVRKHTDPDPEHCRKVHGKGKLQKSSWEGKADSRKVHGRGMRKVFRIQKASTCASI